MAEHITRGQIVRIIQLIAHRHPALLRKDWLYSQLKPIVEALEADLKEAAEPAAEEASVITATEVREREVEEAEALKIAVSAVVSNEPEKSDFGKTQKPVEEKGRKTKGSKELKENKK